MKPRAPGSFRLPALRRPLRVALAALAGLAVFAAVVVHAQVEPVAADTAAAVQTGIASRLSSYLAVSGALFVLGLATIVVRRNALYVLMGVELILNAANLNFVAFGRFGGYGLDGQLMALFVVVLAAAEAAIAMAIVMRIFHDFGTIDITRTDSLRD